jgi:hypothetical protein
LLAIESEPFGNDIHKHSLKEIPMLQPYELEEIIYAAQRLSEAKYINAEFQYAADEIHTFYITSLTWDGHQFLDNISDDDVWNKAKSIASKFSSVSISALSNIASNVISQIIKNQLGI